MTARGRSFEEFLGAYHDVLAATGRAVVSQVPTNVVITGRSGRTVTGRLGPKVGVDYEGTLKGGRSVHIEAKERSDPVRFAVADALAEHQRTFLDAHDRMGGVALVVVRHALPLGHRDYVLTAHDVRELAAAGAVSVRWDTLDATGHAVPPGGGWYEWMVKREGGALHGP